MRNLWCRIVGHRTIAVREVGVAARPNGMLPSLDGYMTYAPDPEGDRLACQRCRRVL